MAFELNVILSELPWLQNGYDKRYKILKLGSFFNTPPEDLCVNFMNKMCKYYSFLLSQSNFFFGIFQILMDPIGRFVQRNRVMVYFGFVYRNSSIS